MGLVLRYIRGRCAAVVDRLPLPDPWNLREFVDQLAQRRGRPIQLLPSHLPAGVCGMWVPTGQADWIVYEPRTSPLHQQHTIAHELGHMVLGHPGRTHEQLAARSAPRYADLYEREAEVFASLILDRVGQLVARRLTGTDVAAVIDTIDPRKDASVAGNRPYLARHRLRGLRPVS